MTIATDSSLWGWKISARVYRWTYGPLAHALDDALFGFLGEDLRGMVVADVGCGPGVVARKLLAGGAERVFAIDVEADMLRQIGDQPGLVPVRGRAEDDVLPRIRAEHGIDGFDLVLFKRSLYQPTDTARAVLRSAWENLRPGGRLCVVHPEASLRRYAFGEPLRIRRHTPYHLFNRTASRIGTLIGAEHYTLYSRDGLRTLLGEVAGPERVVDIPSAQRSFVLVAARRPE